MIYVCITVFTKIIVLSCSTYNVIVLDTQIMSMTYQQFVEYATDLKNHSDSIDDGWNIRQYQCPLVKRAN